MSEFDDFPVAKPAAAPVAPSPAPIAAPAPKDDFNDFPAAPKAAGGFDDFPKAPGIANVGGATVTPKINLPPDIAHPLGRLEAIAQDPGYQAATAYDKAAQAYTANPEQYRQDTLEPVTVPAKTVNVDWEVPPRDDIGTRLQGPPALHSYPIQVPEQRKSALFSTPSTATDYNAVESPLNKVAREAYAKTGDVRYLQHAAMTETFNKPGPGVNIPGVKPETSGHLYMELGEEDLPPNFKRAAEQNAAAIQDPNNVGLQVPHPWILQGPNGKYAVRRGEARDQYIQWWEKQKKIGGAEQKMSAEDQAAALDQRRRDNQYDQTPYPGALRAALQPEEQGDVERAKAQLLGLPRPENTGAEDFLNLPGNVWGGAKEATAGVLGAASHVLPKLQVNPLYGQPKQDPGLMAANEAVGESARKTLEANPVDSKTGKFIGAIPSVVGAVAATAAGGPVGAGLYGAAVSGGHAYQSAFEDVYAKARREGLDDEAAKNLAHAKAFGPAMVSAATGAVLQQLRLPPIVNLPSVVRGGVRYAIENGVERAMTSQEVWAYHIEEAVRHTLAGGTIGGFQDAIDQAAKHVGYNKPIDAQEILDSAIDNAAISAATHLTARAFGEMPKPEQQGDPNAPAAFQGATPGAGPGPQPGQPGAGARSTPPPSGGKYGAKARAKAVRPEENDARETLGIPLNEELNQETVAQYVREAVMRKGVHPDRGGTTQTFQTVWDAGQYLKGRYKGVAGEANARPQAEQPAQEAQPNTRTQQAPPPAAEPEAAAPAPEPAKKPEPESVQTADTSDDKRKDGLDQLSTPELRRRARDAGHDPRMKRDELLAALRGEKKQGIKEDEIGDTVGAAGKGVVDGMYDRMWDDVRKGNIDTSKAPLPEQVVDLAFRRKQITTREEMVALAKEADAIASNAKGDRVKAIKDWYASRFPTSKTEAPKEAPSEQQPETVAKPAPTPAPNAPAQTPPVAEAVAGDAKGAKGNTVVPQSKAELDEYAATLRRQRLADEAAAAAAGAAAGGEGGAVRPPDVEAAYQAGLKDIDLHDVPNDQVPAFTDAVQKAHAQGQAERKKQAFERRKADLLDTGKDAQVLADLEAAAKSGDTEAIDKAGRAAMHRLKGLENNEFLDVDDQARIDRYHALADGIDALTEKYGPKEDRFTPAEVRAAGVPDEVVKKIQESQQQPSREDIASGKALGDSLTKKVDEWIAMGTRNGQLDTSWERGAVKRLVDAEFGGLTKGSHGGKLAAAKIAVGKAKTFDDLKRALAKITGVPNAAPQGIESQSHQPEHQGDGESGAPTRAGGSRSDAVGGKAEGAAGEQPVIEEIGHEGKFILVKAPKDTRSIFDADGLGGRYFAPRGGYLFPAKRRSEVQAEIERHYGPKAEKPTKAAPTTLEGLPIEDPDALESLKSIGRTPSESDRINAEMRGQGPKVGDVIPWAKGDRSATVLKVEQGGAGLNPWAKQIDFYTVEVAQHSLHLPGTSGGLAKKIDNLTVNDLMKQGWKPTTTAPENSNPPAAKADTIKPEATDESPSNTPRSSDKNGEPAPVPVRGDGDRPLDEASAEDGSAVAGGKVPAAGSNRGAGGDQGPVRADGGGRSASGRGDGTGDTRLDQAGEPGAADDAGRAGGKGEPDRGVSKPPAESGKSEEEQANPALADNHTITDSEGLHKGGLKQRFRDNVNAITLAREILGEGRAPTPTEQSALAKYSGWGAMPGAFNPNTDTAGAWEKEAEEIKGLLSDEEFAAAAKSTLNAHYTSGPIVDGMWQMARRLGFEKGRTLEPSLGIGNFYGLMPLDMRSKSQLTGIELDNLTGMIAKLLYPRANVQVKGFEDFNAPDGFFDLAISNFPFGDYRVHDKDYSKYAANIHDYFFLKSLDKVRPGGLVVAITSTGTMDKLESRVRKAIDSRGELIAAIRLPGETFGKTAGTAVVTDILILRRRGGEQEKEGPKWMEVVNVPDPGGGEDIPVNEYFANNPDQIIGTLDRSGTMYRGDSKNVTRGDDFEQKFAEAIDRLPEGIYTHVDRKAARKVKINPDDMKLGGYHTEGGKLFRNTKAGLEEVEGATPAQIKLINDHLAVRDALRDVYNSQLENGTKADTDAKRKALNKAYDSFVKRNGPLHKQANIRAFANDPDSPTILAIENWNQKTKTATKADVFRQNTVRGYEKPTKAENASSALGISLNETGGVDIDRIAGLLGEDPETVGEDMVRAGIAFENPAGGWESAEQYLSGEVRMKLLQAKEAAKAEAKYKPNVTALEAVQPADVEAPDIDVKLGVPWVPVESIVDFAAHLLDGEASHFDARYLPTAAKWFFEYSSRGVQRHGRGVQDTELYGTPYAPFPEVMDAALNATPITIRRKDADGNSYVDQALTADANAKVEAVKALFKEWIWQDDDRREKLARLYNDTFNNVVPVKYNGSHLTFPGMSPFWSQRLRDHQRNAVWRTVVHGSALYAHEVGTGKTATMVASAMELRRLGLARKPAIIALKANIEGVVSDAREIYPGAKILFVEKFDKDNRKRTIAKIASGDWDLVVMTHDNLNMLPMKKGVEVNFINREIEELESVMRSVKGDGDAPRRGGRSKSENKLVKQLEKAKARLQQRLKEALDAPRDDAVTFEETGIDMMFVDEAHKYKSLPVYSKHQRIKGIPTSANRSDRATMMAMRTQWLQELQNGRGVVFATGTPIANSMAELYTNQRYLQPLELQRRGVYAFDAWAANFGNLNTRLEFNVVGGMQPVTRFSEFVNMRNLKQIAGQMMDVQRAKNMPGFKRPTRKDHAHAIAMTPAQKDYLRSLVRRAEIAKKKRPGDPGDNMLSISMDGRKSALDMRMVVPGMDADPNSKLSQAVEKALQIHRDNPGKTQMIFLDLGVNPTEWGFSAYEAIINGLVEGGVPREKIIDFAHLTDADKRGAVKRLNSGDALFGIGGSEKMGTGVNAQKLLIALHHLDAPWKPADLEQRDGRGWRSGNENKEVQIHRYVTTGSFDQFMWQTVVSKHRYITSFMESDEFANSLKEEGDEGELSYSQIMAIASGKPALIEKVNVDRDVQNLQEAQRRHERGQMKLRDAARSLERRIEETTVLADALKKDIATSNAAGEDFALTLDGKTYTDRDEADKAMGEYRSQLYKNPRGKVVGEYRGLKLIASADENAEHVYLEGATQHHARWNLSSIAYAGRASQMENRLDKINEEIKGKRADLAKTKSQTGTQFTGGGELARKQERLKYLTDKVSDTPVPRESGETVGQSMQKAQADGKTVDEWREANPATAAQVGQNGALVDHIWKYLEKGEGGHTATGPDGKSVDLTDIPMYEEPSYLRPEQEPETAGAKLNTAAKPFYSKLQRVIAEKMPARATPDQVRALVTNAAVKADELKWSGLDDFLRDKQGPVTKAEVQEYLRANDVKVEEVMKGQPKAPIEWSPVGNNGTIAGGPNGSYFQISPLPNRKFELRNRHAGVSDLYDSIDEAKDAAQEQLERSGKGNVPTKFSQYQLPGGKNYRELLLTLPVKTEPGKIIPKDEWLKQQSWYIGGQRPTDHNIDMLYKQWVERENNGRHAPAFRSGHWDEPNVLAHVRFSDRTDAEGKKVLHVEEIQSDLHQQGREKGYRDPAEIKRLDKAIADKYAGLKQYAADHKGQPPDETWNRLAKEHGALIMQRDAIKARDIPDAPFAKTWPELAMKRMLRFSAEHGYDKLAWTPGEIQNERYDLSKQVDRIAWKQNANGTYTIRATLPDNRAPIVKEGMDVGELKSVVGKEIADKIVSGEGHQHPQEPYKEFKVLEGDDLRIGGSGMKGFYDKILPDFLNKYAKKWGARVSTTEVSGTNRPLTPSDIDTLQQAPQWPADVPRSVVDRFPADPTWNDVLVSFGSYIGDREAQKAIDDIREHYWFDTEGTTLPSIDITPAMRKSVMEEGQPLFRTQAGTIPPEVNKNGQEAQEQGIGQAGAGIPDSARDQYQAALEAHAPDGATVTRHNEGWAITRPDGRTLDVRLVDPDKMPVPRAGFAESVAAHYGGQLIEGPDGNPFRVPATSDGILKLAPAEYDRLRKAMTIGGAYVNGGILLNNQAHEAGMDLGELVREELFHAKFDQDLTDAQRTALLNEYGDEERAFQAKPGNTAGGQALKRIQGDAKLAVLAKLAKPIKFTGEVAKTIMQAVNWYSEPLVERIEKQAGLMGKRTATTARHANDYARRVVGELNQKMVTALDYVSGKHKQGRKAVRELRQVRMVNAPDVTYGYSVFQSAVEAQQPPGLGPLTLTRAADKAVKNQRAIVMASGDIMVRDGWKVVDASGKVRPFVPVKDGKRMLRSYTPEYWDAVSRPDFDPMKIAIAKAFGHANGKPWQDMMKEMNDSYDPATKKNAAGGEILRTMKYSPTHVTHPDTGRIIQIMHSEPFDAAAMLVRNFALRAGYIKHFGQDLPGQDVTNSLIEAFRKNGGNGDDIKNLIKTFHGIPLDPIHMVSPGTFMYQVVRGFRGVYALSKSGALGLAAVPNLFETLTKTLAMTGVENYARAWVTILAHPVLAPRALADLGARTVDIQNWMGRKGHTLEMMVKNISYMMTVPLKLANELNELQSAAAGATFAADLPNSGPNSRNAATLRLLGYNEDEIRDLTSTKPPGDLLGTVPARIAEQTQGTTSRPSELPNSSHSRVFRTILPFQHWPAMTVNRVLKMLKAIAKPGISARQRAHHARILGSMFSGSLLAGTMGLLLMAWLRGSKDEVAVKYAEAMDEPTHAAYEALKFSVLGGLATTLGESLFDNHDTRLIGPLLNASMPESMLEEFYKATKGVGPYKGETPLERFNTFIGKRVAVAPSIATAMAAWGLGDKNVKLDVALRAYYRWRKQNPSEKGESGPDVTGPDGEAFKFTRAMRHYMDAAQRGDDEKALSALSDALDVKAEEVGKGASEAVAAAIRSRQILAHLSSEEQEKLGKHIGRDAYDQLEEYDMVLEGWARMMKPQAKPHAPHPKRR